MKHGIASFFTASSPKTSRTRRPFVDVFAGRLLCFSRKSSALSTVWILLKPRTILLSCQAKQSISCSTVARRVFHGSFFANRFLIVDNSEGNCLCGRVVPTAPNLQACNSENKGTEVK